MQLQTTRLLENIKYSDVSHLLKEWKALKHNTEEYRTFVQQFVKEIRVYPYDFEIILDVGLGVTTDLTETFSMRRGELYEFFGSRVSEDKTDSK